MGSPVDPTVFISCSADWTVRLWQQGTKDFKELQCFHSVDLSDVVHDIAWCPSTSTIFGSVTGDGRVEIWDLSVSMLDPVICLYADGSRNEDTFDFDDDPDDRGVELPAQTTILFSDNAPVLAVGDSTGNVRIYKVSGLNLTPDLSDKAQHDRLQSTIHPVQSGYMA